MIDAPPDIASISKIETMPGSNINNAATTATQNPIQ